MFWLFCLLPESLPNDFSRSYKNWGSMLLCCPCSCTRVMQKGQDEQKPCRLNCIGNRKQWGVWRHEDGKTRLHMSFRLWGQEQECPLSDSADILIPYTFVRTNKEHMHICTRGGGYRQVSWMGPDSLLCLVYCNIITITPSGKIKMRGPASSNNSAGIHVLFTLQREELSIHFP